MLQPKPTPSYSFTKESRNRKGNALLLPTISHGPAMYNVTTQLNQSSSLILHQYSNRQPIKTLDLPGIGYYDPKNLNTQTSVTFAKSSRKYIRDNNSPGPGEYELPSNLIKGGKLGQNKRTFQNYDNGSPGIGAYSIDRKPYKPTTNQPTFSQVGARRPRFKQFPSPGPTSYDFAKDEWSKRLKVAQSKRSWSYIHKTDSPGPGAYSLEKKKSSKKQNSEHINVSEIQRYNKEKTEKTERTYNSTEILQQHKIKPRISELKIKQQSQPNEQTTKKCRGSLSERQNYKSQKVGISFKKSVRKNEFLDVFNLFVPQPIMRSPGPAVYNTPKNNKQKNGVQFSKQKKEIFKPIDGPGVGSYGELPKFGKTYDKKKPIKDKRFSYFDDIKNLQNQEFL